MSHFEIKCLDHVAIRVKDISTTVAWYEKVLGLQVRRYEEWGDFPIFMLNGETGIAIFPSSAPARTERNAKHIRIDHFAFRVSLENLEKAKEHLTNLNIEYRFEDHTYFHSIYFFDPDDHEVELTAATA